MAGSVQYDCYSGVGSIRLSSAKPGNALDSEMVGDLRRGLLAADADPECRIILLSAAGDVFCAGLSLEAAFGSGETIDPAMLQTYVECLLALCGSSKPAVVQVQGEATGGGLGLVAACDLVIASDRAVFALPEVTVGLIPALITPFLLRRLSPARVRYLSLSSRRIDAREAHLWGLVDELAGGEPDDPVRIERVVQRQLQRLLRSSPAALAGYKEYLYRLTGDELAAYAQTGLEAASAWMTQPDVVEAVGDLLAGRSLPWSQSYRRRDDDHPS